MSESDWMGQEMSGNQPARIQRGDLRRRIIVGCLLLVIMIAGGVLRFMSLNWDDFSALHPDERFLTRNLLPLIGGNLEFTPDERGFPAHVLLAGVENASIYSQVDLTTNQALRAGGVRGTTGGDLALWMASAERYSEFDSVDAALRALTNGEIDALIVPQSDTQNVSSADIVFRIVEVYDSVTVQRMRCTLLYPNTGGAGGYFDTFCSPYNPHNASSGAFAYGTLPLFIAHFASQIVRADTSGLFSFQGETLVWRFFSALADVISLLLVFMIGRRLHNSWTGLLAAVLYAFAPLAIQKAHFGTVNAITNMFVMLAIWSAAEAQERGRFRHFVIFGIALGGALAGRINILPLAGVIVLAGMVYGMPVLDDRLAKIERDRYLWRVVAGVVLAGFFTVLAFRLFNPYAFEGPSLAGIMPNQRWIADAQSSSFNVSGASDIPPNWQWLGRAEYLFPLKDIMLWGLGLASSLMAILGFFWSGYRLLLGKPGAVRNLLPFVWALVYFAWMGRVWVMTMRYYLPLYGVLCLLGGWALFEMWQIARKQEREPMLARIMLVIFGVILGAVALVAGRPVVTATAAFAGVVALILLVTAFLPLRRAPLVALTGFVVGFSVLWGVMYSNIYQHQLTRVQAARWMWENVSGDFSMLVQGESGETPLINIAIGNSSGDSAERPEDLLFASTRFTVGVPLYVEFVAPASGTVSEIYAPHLGDPLDTPEEETLYISLARTDGEESALLAETTLTVNMTRDEHITGSSYTIPLPDPVELEAGRRYMFKAESLAGTFISSGEVMLTEGAWDDRITTTMICNLPDGMTLADDPRPGLVSYDACGGRMGHYALLQSYDLVMSYPVDEEIKRQNIVDGLGAGDYLAITSNRFYDTETRNPARFPLTTRYYELLFAGELGYELVATFRESFELGPLSVDDQHLPIYQSPAWLNELEADEAFHVYDHPVVFIFRKQDDYDHNRTELLLNEVSLLRADAIGMGPQPAGAQIAGVVYWNSLEADRAMTALQLPEDIRQINREGGTWSERFDSESILNQSQPVGVVVWWLTVMAIGWMITPMLFVAFSQVGDAGFGFAKIIGLLLVGWAAWIAANFKLALWSQGGLALIVALLLAGNLALFYRNRVQMVQYLRQNWRRMLAQEVLATVLFAAFVAIRMTNPDLWHHPMGGEKPMDFAYFNAVLRSTAFPAYDPWYAGGYINYYYFGYVIVGVPVLLLKIVPAFAYNLIIPTLFAATGMGAFSAAYGMVERWMENRGARPNRIGNPWVAGIAALVLCVVLGNLDIPRVIAVEGIARLGGYERPTGLENYLIEQYTAENGVEPDETALYELRERAKAGYLGDEISYEIAIKVDFITSFVRGLGPTLSGATLPIGSNRWYWAPTRVIQETPGVADNAITEMPFFTFLYGDLHAHMISMSIMLFVIFFVFNEVAVARNDERSVSVILLALIVGGISVGMLRAINTWDWPTFLLLGVLGLGYAWWRRYETINRVSLLAMVSYISAFVVMAWAAVLPFVSWFGSGYNSVLLWEGARTPLWAYLDIHGVFLFLTVSLLLWDTANWLRLTKVGAVAGRRNLFITAAVIVLAIVLASVGLAMMGYQAALIVLPLIVWIGVLFFRPRQHVVMQYALVLVGLALALTLAVEFVVLSGDIGRQNTVFKFYIQVWLLFSVGGGVAFAGLVSRVDEWRTRLRLAWVLPLLLLVLVAAMFPVLATRARMLDRFVPNLPATLNGIDYMQQATHGLIDYGVPIQLYNDYQIIRWLQENVQGTPVVLEGRSLASEYRYNGRIAINTGLPTILGWNWHQRQQRTLDPLSRFVMQREANIQYLYNTTQISEIVPLLRHYRVEYIIVSDMERAMYPAAALEKFDGMTDLGLLRNVFQSGESIVYEVDEAALESFALHTQVFYESIGLDIEQLWANTPAYPQSSGYIADPLVDVSAALAELDRYPMQHVVISDPLTLPSLGAVFDRITRLEALDVLRVTEDRAEWRIWTVNQDAVEAILAEAQP